MTLHSETYHILDLSYSRLSVYNIVDLANHRYHWYDYALLLSFVAILLHFMINGLLFVVITIIFYCLPSCSHNLSMLPLA